LCTTRLLGSYRKCDAADPEIFSAAIEDVLAHYAPHIQQAVTDPYGGLPSRSPFPPNPFEVKQACEELAQAEWARKKRAEDLQKQFANRRADDALRARITYRRNGDATPRAGTIEPARVPPAGEGKTDQAIREVWRDFAAGLINEAEAARRDQELRALVHHASASFDGAGSLAAACALPP
jgi:hypothetical protein